MEVKDLKIGTRFELEILGNNGNKIGNTLISQLLEPAKNSSLIISAPIFESRLIFVPLNARIGITFLHARHGLQGFTAVVTAREQRGTLSILCVEPETQPQKIQRRTYYRLDCNLNVEYRLHTDDAQEPDSSRYIRAITKNISGSGVCIVSGEEIEKNTLLEVNINLNEKIVIRAVCSICRCVPLEMSRVPKFELGLKFIEITPQNRDYIIKFIFEKQRMLLKKGN